MELAWEPMPTSCNTKKKKLEQTVAFPGREGYFPKLSLSLSSTLSLLKCLPPSSLYTLCPSSETCKPAGASLRTTTTLGEFVPREPAGRYIARFLPTAETRDSRPQHSTSTLSPLFFKQKKNRRERYSVTEKAPSQKCRSVQGWLGSTGACTGSTNSRPANETALHRPLLSSNSDQRKAYQEKAFVGPPAQGLVGLPWSSYMAPVLPSF